MGNSTQAKSDKVLGVGEGLGMALVLRFAQGYRVALVARSPEVIGKTATQIKSGSDTKDDDLLKPSAIADAFWYLAHQDPSAWSHELDVRPFKEKF